MSFLELDRVGKQFGAQSVVDDFSLAVGKGEFISFLGPSGCGKTNDFAATIDRTAVPARLVAGSWSSPAPAGFNGPVTISIRPERIGFGDAGLNAKIVTRIFQGNHWLFQCDSECGPAIVIRQNDGQAQPAEGDAVRLTWRSEDMSVRARAGA